MDNPGKGLGIASLICGIAGIFTAGISSIVGIVLGIISMKKSNEAGAPKGLAIGGLISSAVTALGGFIVGGTICAICLCPALGLGACGACADNEMCAEMMEAFEEGFNEGYYG